MDTDLTLSQVAHDFPPFLRVYTDGRVERFFASPYFPPTTYPNTGVESKDVVISPDINLRARLCLPKYAASPDQKLPLVVHYHGGGFCVGSAFGTVCNHFLTALASHARAIVVSVEYRLAPEHPLPVAYEDSWAALLWVAAHAGGGGPDPWINRHAAFGRVFLAGESAGANIAHNMAVRVGVDGRGLGLCVEGLIVAHPYFAAKEPDRLIRYLYPGSSGADDDPKLSPAADPDLTRMKGARVLVCVAEKDWLKPRGVSYYETLRNSGWGGEIELVEHEGEGHCFYMFDPKTDRALAVIQKFSSFINLKK